MAKFIVKKSGQLKGTVRIGGAKNAALPILAGALLAGGCSVIDDCPVLSDIEDMCDILTYLGCGVKRVNNSICVDASNIGRFEAPYELTNKFRASFLVAGPLLARHGYAKISLPGGCAIGTRPVDLHLKGFAAMGADVRQGSGYVEVSAKQLKGTKIYLDFPSVGATENILMAACLADGQTIIENAAVEPEITDLANFVSAMGADIRGAGTDTIKINGARELHGVNYTIIPDRIEAGTYMCAVAVTGGSLVLDNVISSHLKPVSAKLREIGALVVEEGDSITVTARERLKSSDIKTLPFPGFPTDMQAQFTSLMNFVEGTSVIVETVFENRFMHVGELRRMGANIKVEGRTAVIDGVNRLSGAKVRATDLRAGAALIIAALGAEGETEISDIEYIDRGYCAIEKKLRSLGAEIARLE